MTLTVPVEHQLFTAERYFALGEDEALRDVELQEGTLVVAPGALTRHMRGSAMLFQRMREQLPSRLEALYEIDIDLQLVPPDQPGTVRRPDIAVLTKAEVDRAAASVGPAGYPRVGCAVLIVEVVSPGSIRMDRLIKRAEYADAGIPHYWIVELEPAVQLTACRLEDGRYVDDGPVTDVFETPEPFPFRLDVTALG